MKPSSLDAGGRMESGAWMGSEGGRRAAYAGWKPAPPGNGKGGRRACLFRELAPETPTLFLRVDDDFEGVAAFGDELEALLRLGKREAVGDHLGDWDGTGLKQGDCLHCIGR